MTDAMLDCDLSTTTLMSIFAGLSGVLLAFTAPGCGSADGCGTDQDCKGDRICSSGDCVSPDDGGGGDNTDDGTNDDGSNNDGSDGGGSSEEVWCCLNGAYYDCPDAEAGQACFENMEPGSCTRDSSRDSECDQDGGGSGGGSGDGGGDSDSDVGQACSLDQECEFDACVEESFDSNGYCSKPCNDFSDCPDFWSCEEPEGFSSKHCVQD